MKMNTTSSSGSKTLPGNTITKPKEELKGITARSGTAYQGPMIPTTSSSLPPVVERETETTKDMVPLLLPSLSPLLLQLVLRSLIKNFQFYIHQEVMIKSSATKLMTQREKFFQTFKDLNFNIRFVDALILMPKFGPSIKSLLTNKDKLFELARTSLNKHCSTVILKKLLENWGTPATDFVVVDFDADPRVPLILGRSFLKIERALIDVFKEELTIRVGKEAITFNLDQTSRYSANYNDMTENQIDVIDMAYEEYSQEVLGFSDEVDQCYVDTEGDILLLEAFLNDDPSLPPPNRGNYLPQVRKEIKLCEAKTDKSLYDEPPKVELKDLPPHLECAFLEGNDKLPVIITKDLSVEEKAPLITVLKSHKRAIPWKLFDIKGIDPEFYTDKILMEEDFEPAVQHQIRVNLKIQDVIKTEVLKLLDVGLIYPIFDSPWVTLVHCVPKKGGFIVVENEENELILTFLVTGWCVCIEYRKLNEATRKDHFPLPFMDQMLERLAGNEYYHFLDGFLGYFQIRIDPKYQEKTTCPYGTFAYRRMPFGLCNAPGTFQRCMMAIFHDMIEKTMEVFMDDLSVFGNSILTCLSHFEKMLKWCSNLSELGEESLNGQRGHRPQP
nr:reverse transcriptase domain-containing protein [Tanacetum cinerariifolium]